MKQFLLHLAALTLAFTALFYGVFSFCLMNCNVVTWTESCRIGFSVIILIFMLIIALILEARTLDEKKRLPKVGIEIDLKF